MIDKINYKNLSFILIIITTINYIFFTYRFFQRENGFILGDWIINYEGGFTRRGLIGEIITTLSEFFSINLINITFVIVVSLYLLFIFLLLRLINRSKIDFLIILLIFSPATLLFNVYDPLAVGRKEFLIFLFFIIYLNFRDRKYAQFYLPFGAMAVSLTHELFFLLTPMFFINRFIRLNSYRYKDYKVEIFIFTISLVSFISILLITNSDPILTCNYIKNFGLSSDVCWAINLTSGSKAVFSDFYKESYYINYYSIFFLLIIMHIFIILKINLNIGNLKSISLILLSIISILALFLIVNDWGRYMNSFAFIWMLILIFNSKISHVASINFLKILLIILFSFSWYMPHCCPERHFTNIKYKPGIFYIFERINYRINN